ncbi:trypsin-1-like [Drosophila busckii]|uniref:trypsin-1-like n=1 Tax=Drosophila busckii TaxID=30019 RepID=UPI001432E49A|nr:trypsin-1-like [Drosophila busckii]
MSFWLPSGLASTPPPMDISDIDKYDATDEDSKEVNGARSNEIYEHTEETDDDEEEDPDFNEIQNLISPSINGTKEDLLHKVFELLDNVDSENVLHELEQAINDAFNSIETSKWYCESGNTATAKKTNQFFTGTLIHPEIVLSVAAYVNKKTPEDYRVVAGDWDEKTTDEILANEELRVKTIQVHPAFDHNSYANNVALLFLNGHFTLMSHILPIALPKPPGKLHRHCLVSGWNQKGRSYERNLKVSMPLSVAPCSKEVQSLYCVNAAKKDLQYAEGAGMACKVDDFANEYYLIGVWSHGLGASVSKTKFVSVEAVLPWIKAEQKNYSEKQNNINVP